MNPETLKKEFEEISKGSREFIEFSAKQPWPKIPEGYKDCCYWCGHSPDRLLSWFLSKLSQAQAEAIETLRIAYEEQNMELQKQNQAGKDINEDWVHLEKLYAYFDKALRSKFPPQTNLLNNN